MLSHSHSKYRSVKYSTSSQNIHKVKTDAEEDMARSKSRLSLCKQNHSPFASIVQRPKTPNNIKMLPLESRWGNGKPASSQYKLRIVASSSHTRTRCSEKEDQEVKKEEGAGFKLNCNQSPPFNDYCEHLIESLADLPTVLQSQRLETDSIRVKLQLIKKQVQSQLALQQQRFRLQASKLRLQMSLSFKNHSKQIINTRESVLNLHQGFQSLRLSLAATSLHLQGLDDNFNA